MTYTYVPFDLKGVFFLRTFTSVASLPASPTPNQMCGVDDGTTSALYQAVRTSPTTVAWQIVASPIPPAVLVRTDPSDTRKSQISYDDAATWSDLAYYPGSAVTKAPLSALENTIEGASTYPALTVENTSNQNALVVNVTGGQGIRVTATDGTNDSPAILVIKPTGSTYPNLIEAANGIFTYGVVNQYGAIEAIRLNTLPTPDATWEQSFAYITPGVGIDGAIFGCIKKADGAWAWVQIAPQITPPPPENLGFIAPPLPAIGDAPIEFYAIIMSAIFWDAPYNLPFGYTLTLVSAYGRWTGNWAGGTRLATTYLGYAPSDPPYRLIDGIPYQRLVANLYDTTGAPLGAGTPIDITAAPITMTQETQVQLAENTDGGFPAEGYVIARLRIAGPTTFVTISYTDGSGPFACAVGDTITITPDTFTSFGGYRQFLIHFSALSTWKWISGDVLQRPTAPCDWCWNVDEPFSCAGPDDTYYQDTTESSNGYSSVNAHQGENHQARDMSSTNGNLSGPFQLQLVSIP